MKKEILEALATVKSYCENSTCIDCPLQQDWCGRSLEPWEWELCDIESEDKV